MALDYFISICTNIPDLKKQEAFYMDLIEKSGTDYFLIYGYERVLRLIRERISELEKPIQAL